MITPERMERPPPFILSLKDALKTRETQRNHLDASKCQREECQGDHDSPKTNPQEVEDTGYASSHLQMTACSSTFDMNNDSLPIVLVTNDDGIHAPGLRALIEALVSSNICHVLVCAPDCNKSGVGHSITLRKSVEVSPVDIKGAIAYEVSGTPADCVSLSLSGLLFPPKEPSLVLSGINKGSNCGYHVLYSGTVAGAREGLIRGVPSIAFSLNWKRGESTDKDFKTAANLCVSIVRAALRDMKKGLVSKGCYLNIDIPTNPLKNKGFKITRQGSSRLATKWRAVSSDKHVLRAGFCKESALGVRLAELGSAASAVAAARRMNSPLKNMEIESIAGPENGFSSTESSKKLYFLNDTVEAEVGSADCEFDFGALNEGYITITPLGLTTNTEVETFDWASKWISTAIEFTAPSSL